MAGVGGAGGSGGGSTFGGTVTAGGGGGRGTGAGTGGAGGSGTVTVGTETVGTGGTALSAAPAHVPRAAAERASRPKATVRRGIEPITDLGPGAFRERRGMRQDFYEVLGVRKNADQDTIKRAFRAQSRALHPDVCPDPEAESRFREVSEAYAVLSKPETRRLYDRFGWRGKGGGFERRPARVYTSNPREFLQDLDSLIQAASGKTPDRRPTRVVASVELDAYEAHVGAKRRVMVSTDEPCPDCAGSGRERVVSERDDRRLVSLVDCSACGGTGTAADEKVLDVSVPPGVRDLDRVPVGPKQVAVVKVVAARDRAAIRGAAFAGLLGTLAFLGYLVSLS
jgi:DnaJ domain